MRRLGRILGRSLLLLVVVLGGLWVFGPYEPAPLRSDFDALVIGSDVDAYLAGQEAKFDDITPGVHKRVLWAFGDKRKTPFAVVYIHGFSATAEEIRPVPDIVARKLGSNLIYTRLQGHGRDGDAMAEGSVAGWMHDLDEALAIAQRIGERTLVLSASTGSTLVAGAITQAGPASEVAGAVMVSPNFGTHSPFEPMLTLPAVRWWGPVLAGRERSWQAQNPLHEKYWSTRYPSVATLPMAALVKRTMQQDFAGAHVPALFIYAESDQVVRAERTDMVVQNWGGPAVIMRPALGEGVDPNHHVVAGDILSPANSIDVAQSIVNWAGGL